MSLSTYEQPLPDSRCKEAASGHYGKDSVVKGNWHIYPEMAAAGLWTTPTDLARWALEITSAWNGRNSNLLSKSIARQMMTPQKTPSGLGILLEEKDRVISFTHGGGNEGFRSEFVMFPAEGKGAVVMTNSNQGSFLVREVFQSIAAEYHWPGYIQSERDVVILGTEQIDSIAGTYFVLNLPISYEISHQGDHLYCQIEDEGILNKIEIYAANINEFFSLDGLIIVFYRDNLGRVTKMKTEDLEAIRQQ